MQELARKKAKINEHHEKTPQISKGTQNPTSLPCRVELSFRVVSLNSLFYLSGEKTALLIEKLPITTQSCLSLVYTYFDGWTRTYKQAPRV